MKFSKSKQFSISNKSGRFPKASNLHEFKENLYGKVDMGSELHTFWHPELPRRGGRIANLEKFDAQFFSFMDKNANAVDPQCRILLELCYEAIIDAGMSPNELMGTNTGVFVGSCLKDALDNNLHKFFVKNGWILYG